MRIMTRMGDIAWKELGDSDNFNRGLHSKEQLDRDRRAEGLHRTEDEVPHERR